GEGGQRKVDRDRRLNGVDPFPRRLDHDVAGIVDDVGVIADTARQAVSTHPSVDNVCAVRADQVVASSCPHEDGCRAHWPTLPCEQGLDRPAKSLTRPSSAIGARKIRLSAMCEPPEKRNTAAHSPRSAADTWIIGNKGFLNIKSPDSFNCIF